MKTQYLYKEQADKLFEKECGYKTMRHYVALGNKEVDGEAPCPPNEGDIILEGRKTKYKAAYVLRLAQFAKTFRLPKEIKPRPTQKPEKEKEMEWLTASQVKRNYPVSNNNTYFNKWMDDHGIRVYPNGNKRYFHKGDIEAAIQRGTYKSGAAA